LNTICQASASTSCYFEAVSALQGSRSPPAACRILCLRFTHLVRYAFYCSFSWVRSSTLIFGISRA